MNKLFRDVANVVGSIALRKIYECVQIFIIAPYNRKTLEIILNVYQHKNEQMKV